MSRAAAEGIPLTICPTSNIVIANRYRSLREHPFRAIRDSGVPVTINTDDPAMEALDTGLEYRNVAGANGDDVAEMGRIAIQGIESSWLDDDERRSLRAEFEAALARPGPAL